LQTALASKNVWLSSLSAINTTADDSGGELADTVPEERFTTHFAIESSGCPPDFECQCLSL
jgi:hypothetical protein